MLPVRKTDACAGLPVLDINFASKCLISEIHVHCSRIDLKLCEYHRLAGGARGSEINFAEMQLVLPNQPASPIYSQRQQVQI